MNRLRTYLIQRAPLIGTFALLGGISAVCKSPSTEPGEDGVRANMAQVSGLEVGSFLWEPSRGALVDWWVGRGIVFEGRTAQAEKGAEPPQRDIYRMIAQVSPEGHVLDLGSLRNLTQTVSGDESQLVGNERGALFASRASSIPSSISLLDYAGEPRSRNIDPLGRVQLALSRLIDSGTWGGLGRVDFLPKHDSDTLSVGLDKSRLTIQGHGRTPDVSVKLEMNELWSQGTNSAFTQLSSSEITLFSRDREPVPWTHFGANVGRKFLGTGAIAWLEGRVFETWDTLHRAGYSVSHQSKSTVTPAPVPLTYSPKSTEGIWPPADIKLGAGFPEHDGKWTALRSKLHEQEGEPYFYRTILHSDAERPYAELHLIAFDMRRLELGMRAGYEDPKPEAGPPGSGQLPSDESTSRVVATFNGAFKADHGSYGMKAEGRLLVKPVVGAASVVVDHGGKVGFGDWGPEMDAEQFAAFRQNLDPLVGHGKVNPRGRKVWGDHLYGEGVAATRSALCLHHSGQLVYAWATEATGMSFARGLSLAGCVYAIHLDMNPGHCAFMFNRVESVEPLVAKGEVLDPRMQVNATRYVRWSPKDFFYLAKRAGAPSDSAITWKKAPGRGPAPESIPGIFLGLHSIGGIQIEIDRVAPGRLEFLAEAGTAEANGQSLEETGTPQGLTPDQGARTLIAWGLGHRTRGLRTGLTLGQKVIVPLTRSYASLVLEADSPPELLPPGEPLVETEARQVIQLPLLARDGKLLPQAQELGGHRTRSALCIDDHGSLYFGRVKHDTSAPLVQAMLDQGCKLVAEMDRGSHDPPLVERAATESPPHRGYEQTILYGLARAMEPRTWLIENDAN